MGLKQKHNENRHIENYMSFLNKKYYYVGHAKTGTGAGTAASSTKMPQGFKLGYNNYMQLAHYNLKINELKQLAKQCKIRVCGKKDEIYQTIMLHCCLSKSILKIQSLWRGHILRRLLKLRGPALKLCNRNLCNNSSDFISLEQLETIDVDYFYSYENVITISRPTSRAPSLGQYEDVGGASHVDMCVINQKEMYGFNITSLFQYMKKPTTHGKGGGGGGGGGALCFEKKNPYNRDILPQRLFDDLLVIIRLSRIVGRPLNMKMDDDTKMLNIKQQMELRAVTLFQYINFLDNYSDAKWFLDLDIEQTKGFVRELADIWNHRANILLEAKRSIIPPDGQLFKGINIHNLLGRQESDIVKLKKTVLQIMERLVQLGGPTEIDNNWRKLGAMYILSALTLVNHEAAEAMPIYYYSVLAE